MTIPRISEPRVSRVSGGVPTSTEKPPAVGNFSAAEEPAAAGAASPAVRTPVVVPLDPAAIADPEPGDPRRAAVTPGSGARSRASSVNSATLSHNGSFGGVPGEVHNMYAGPLDPPEVIFTVFNPSLFPTYFPYEKVEHPDSSRSLLEAMRHINGFIKRHIRQFSEQTEYTVAVSLPVVSYSNNIPLFKRGGGRVEVDVMETSEAPASDTETRFHPVHYSINQRLIPWIEDKNSFVNLRVSYANNEVSKIEILNDKSEVHFTITVVGDKKFTAKKTDTASKDTDGKSSYVECFYTNGKDVKSYTGEWANGRPHGNGRFIYNNGDVFTGIVDKGLPSTGTMYYHANPIYKSYIGSWENGLPSGEGTFIYINEDVFVGVVDKGIPVSGKIAYSDGNTYDGKLFHDKMHGKGKNVFSSPNFEYSGWFKNNMPYKEGVLKMNDKHYKIEFAEDGTLKFNPPAPAVLPTRIQDIDWSLVAKTEIVEQHGLEQMEVEH